ncbi:MAG TPA: hypothetical protein VGD98_03365 [Ktedonobacteraceae bacterium]
MPNSFAITVATNTVFLNANRQGRTAFTVSNTNAFPVRGRARIEALSVTAGAWLELLEEAERSFASQDSHQYIVQIAVPPNAPAGEYTFRLDMVDVANPDDDFSEGPTVKFVVALAAPKPRPFPWWIVAAVVVALLIISGAIFGIVKAGQHPTAQKPLPATATATIQPTAAPPSPSPTPPLGIAQTESLVIAYYDHRGAFAGVYVMNNITALTYSGQTATQFTTCVAYNYALPGSPQTSQGSDRRTFLFQLINGSWQVVQMGNNQSC